MDGQEFLRRMRAGDAKVWDDVIPLLRAAALGACRDLRVFDTLCEDIVQDVSIRAFTDWASYRGESRLSTWIYSIARHRCLDEMRRRKVRGEGLDTSHASDEDDADGAHDPSYRPDIEQTLCVQQMIAELEAQGDARKGGKRMIEVVTWWVMHSPTSEELADFLETSVAAAKERKSYILRRIKQLCLKFCGHEDCSMSSVA